MLPGSHRFMPGFGRSAGQPEVFCKCDENRYHADQRQGQETAVALPEEANSRSNVKRGRRRQAAYERHRHMRAAQTDGPPEERDAAKQKSHAPRQIAATDRLRTSHGQIQIPRLEIRLSASGAPGRKGFSLDKGFGSGCSAA